jgi:hypothetical protein
LAVAQETDLYAVFALQVTLIKEFIEEKLHPNVGDFDIPRLK